MHAAVHELVEGEDRGLEAAVLVDVRAHGAAELEVRPAGVEPPVRYDSSIPPMRSRYSPRSWTIAALTVDGVATGAEATARRGRVSRSTSQTRRTPAAMIPKASATHQPLYCTGG